MRLSLRHLCMTLLLASVQSCGGNDLNTLRVDGTNRTYTIPESYLLGSDDSLFDLQRDSSAFDSPTVSLLIPSQELASHYSGRDFLAQLFGVEVQRVDSILPDFYRAYRSSAELISVEGNQSHYRERLGSLTLDYYFQGFQDDESTSSVGQQVIKTLRARPFDNGDAAIESSTSCNWLFVFDGILVRLAAFDAICYADSGEVVDAFASWLGERHLQ